eukprot:scaffold28620_cov94-Skeletonema_dohrnii-CCMP3373.AAC.3
MPPPEENSKRSNKMLLVRQYTNSFSNIDWGGLGKSTRRISIKPRQQLPREFSAYSIDIPSMDDEGGVASSGREKKKGSKRRLSVTFAVNDEMIDNSCHEDIMEDGQRICAEKSESATMSSTKSTSSSSSSSSSWSWCLVFTLLGIVVGAAICFITFPPNTASLNLKKAMSGIRDWKSSSNNSVVQQQLLQQQQQGRGQEMLELAEQITAACGGESSHSSTGASSSCQVLCHNHMCCVEQDDEYSCKSDVMKDCGVYAGCMALIDDNLW